MMDSIMLFIAMLPDNIRAAAAILTYIAAYFLVMVIAIYGGNDVKKNNTTTLQLYNSMESDAIRNAIETRLEVLSVVPTLQAAAEYLTLQQIAGRMPERAETTEVSSEHA